MPSTLAALRLMTSSNLMVCCTGTSAGFIAPCLPTNAPQPPCGEEWGREIKHDGFRVIARKEGKRVKLYSRPGNHLTYRFSLIAAAVSELVCRGRLAMLPASAADACRIGEWAVGRRVRGMLQSHHEHGTSTPGCLLIEPAVAAAVR